MSVEIEYGYICPICRKAHGTLESAVMCLNSHVRFETEERHVMSQEYPIDIKLTKYVGMTPVSYRHYKPDGDVKEIKQ